MREPITIGGVTYALNHLDTELIRDVPMTDFAEKEFKRPVFVTYSCHCYSRGESDDFKVTAPPEDIIWDGRWPRQFCDERYNLSKILPGVVKGLLYSPHALVFDTGKGNRHYHELVATPNSKSQVPYYLFMRIERTQLENNGHLGPHVIKMAVESAHAKHPPFRAPAAFDPLPMRVWLGKTWSPPPAKAASKKKKWQKK